MNLVKHMSSNTTDRACLAYTRQSAFGRRQSLPRVSYTSTMKQIMGCYYLHIERTQTVRKNSSVGNDRPLSLICLLRSSSFSEAGPQVLPSVLTSVRATLLAYMYAAAELGRNPVRKHDIQPEYRDEQADAGRDCRTRRLARPRGQGNTNFPCSADHEQDWQPYPVDPYSCYMCDHTMYI